MHYQTTALERLGIMAGSAFNLEAYPVFLSTLLNMFDLKVSNKLGQSYDNYRRHVSLIQISIRLDIIAAFKGLEAWPLSVIGPSYLNHRQQLRSYLIHNVR